MAPQIPDRWLKYQPIGGRVEGTRFIAFKVPLAERINKFIDESDRLHGKLLLEKVPNLGVIIDLTNTNRYYDSNFFINEGVEHTKIMIPGHITPAPRLVNRFKEIVKQFIQNNSDNDKLIGVHCTHGVNRTGYLICNYMVSELSVDPSEAINKFAEARGHRIERKNYLDSLRTLNSDEDVGNNTPEKREQTRGHPSYVTDEHFNSKKEENGKNWRADGTDKVEYNWRIQRDKATKRNINSSRHNWRSDNRSKTINPDGERYSCPDKRIRTAHSSEYNRHNSYSQHKQGSQFRDSNNSQHATYNNNQYFPKNSNYSCSSRTTSTSSNTDNTTKLLRTDYYNEPRTPINRKRISHYSGRQQQQ